MPSTRVPPTVARRHDEARAWGSAGRPEMFQNWPFKVIPMYREPGQSYYCTPPLEMNRADALSKALLSPEQRPSSSSDLTDFRIDVTVGSSVPATWRLPLAQPHLRRARGSSEASSSHWLHLGSAVSLDPASRPPSRALDTGWGRGRPCLQGHLLFWFSPVGPIH